MSTYLHRLGRACARARGRVVAAWLLLLLVVAGLLGVAGSTLDESFSIPGTEAQVALDELEETFPQTASGSVQVVVHSEDGTVTGDAVRDDVSAGLAEVAQVDGVASVTDPYTGLPLGADPRQAGQVPDAVDPVRVSEDGSTLYATVQLDGPSSEASDATLEGIESAMAGVDARAGIDLSYGGDAFREAGLHLSIVEVIGVLLALVVLAVTFRSVVAALLPIGTAIIGVGVATGAVLLASNAITISSSAPTLGMMIGLAVGIDYALFVVSRHRELLATGLPVDEAAGRATGTAGSAVVFAGATVVIALCGLSVAQIPFLTVMGFGAAFSVVVAVLIALTLLPAMLGLASERLRPRRQAESTALDEGCPISSRWTRVVRRGRWLVAAAAVAFLVVLALPASSLRLALPDNGIQEAGTTQRVAYDTIAAEFGPGYNGPLTVSADLGDVASPEEKAATVDALATRLSQVDGVESIATAAVSESGETAVLAVVPSGAPTDSATADLVTSLRDLAESDPELAAVDLAVTGQTAVNLDVSDQLADALVPFGLVVIGLSLLLLMIVFRSILVPVTASLGYLLSTAASFGVVALVFEHGWLASAIGVEQTGPVISFLPIMLMGVLFGLAMDYQVFLVSRMREHHVHGGTSHASVAAGIRQSSSVVVAAALIMIAVFAAFVPTGDATLQPIAFALAIGVLLDAFVVRLTLIPALMHVLGDKAWWLPRWLDRLLPELDIEGAALEDAQVDEPDLVGAR